MRMPLLPNFIAKATGDLSLIAKGLIVVMIPLLTQSVFVLVLWHYQTSLQSHNRLSNHSKEVLLTYAEPYGNLMRGVNRSILGMLLNDAALLQHGAAELDGVVPGVDRMLTLVADNPAQVERLLDIRARSVKLAADVRMLIERSDALSAVVPEAHDREVQVIHQMLRNVADDSRGVLEKFDDFASFELALDRERTDAFERSFERSVGTLGFGTIAMVLVSLVMLAVFRETLSTRMRAVLASVESVPRGGTNHPVLAGRDEFAKIDRAVHSLAQALADKDFETELFIYSVSHDLRSPLVNLHGFSEEIRFASDAIRHRLERAEMSSGTREELLRLVDDDIRGSLKFIKDSTQRMSTIIDALLRLSRAGRMNQERSVVQLETVVQRVLGSLRAAIEQRDAEVSVGALPAVYASQSGVEQILQNLIVNALKYLSPERRGRVEIGTVPDGSDHLVTIYVKDNGLGIPSSAREKIFLAFQRFHPDLAPGEGIGLALVKRLVARSDGVVRFDSVEGAGSCFYVSLPLPTTEQLRAEPDPVRVATNG